MLAEEISIPVYFAKWSPELETVVNEVQRSSTTSDKTKTAAEAMFTSVAASGYQIVISPGTPNVKSDVKIATVQGYLAGQSHDGKAPTVAVVAHYDSYGVAPVSHERKRNTAKL